MATCHKCGYKIMAGEGIIVEDALHPPLHYHDYCYTMLDQLMAQLAWLTLQPGIGARVDDEGRMCCFYCGGPMNPVHVDHINPVSKGGADEAWNKAYVCAECNKRKHAVPLTLFLLRNRKRVDMDEATLIELFARLLLSGEQSLDRALRSMATTFTLLGK